MNAGKSLIGALLLAMSGCEANQMDNSGPDPVIPKVETGDQPADLDPKTDKDVDVDTAVPGDS